VATTRSTSPGGNALVNAPTDTRSGSHLRRGTRPPVMRHTVIIPVGTRLTWDTHRLRRDAA
jgi:hypothetical protein